MKIDSEKLITSLGGTEVVSALSHEERADAIESYMTIELESMVTKRQTKMQLTVADHEARVESRGYRRGAGKLFVPEKPIGPNQEAIRENVLSLPPMPAKPTLHDFFRLRFHPANHLLQSAALARRNGADEEVVMACLLHDIGGNLIKVDHGYWGAQLIEPYVSERITFAVRYHQALRFFPDPEFGYEYPKSYYQTFGIDYVPPPHIVADYEFARSHKWYIDARLVTINDLYAFDPNVDVSLDEFDELIAKHFRNPAEGLGYDAEPVSHMWRSLINPDAPL